MRELCRVQVETNYEGEIPCHAGLGEDLIKHGTTLK